jgi:hypothetical protein
MQNASLPHFILLEILREGVVRSHKKQKQKQGKILDNNRKRAKDILSFYVAKKRERRQYYK